jgi:hypothetical protein
MTEDNIFSQQDLRQMEALGISLFQVKQQIGYFEKGFPYISVVAPALPGEGIHCLSAKEQDALIARYDEWRGSRVKFVPASGAASRMFKDLYEAQSLLEKDPNAALSKPAAVFFEHLPSFAFYPLLQARLGAAITDRLKVLRSLLGEEGLAYGSQPKGLLAFHTYSQGARTAFEEHLVEAALYAANHDGAVNLHFTVSPEHREGFEALCRSVVPVYEQRFGLKYQISFSEQQKSTDTLAVDAGNRPFRLADGSLLFRPGGHGALLENLGALDQDLVFVKNIDNVVSEAHLADTLRWKKVLAGKLLELREYIFAALQELDKYDSPLKIKEIAAFLAVHFSITLPQTDQQHYAGLVRSLLERPLRVCGMVRNTGEPGGGPFIVKDAHGATSLQILEAAQLNAQDPHTPVLLAASAYFNPVDMVCSFKNYCGAPYALPMYRDENTGFISEKSKDGQIIKVQELPGLWNGAMSHWNTLFVEVPESTFHPVKTVNDLLRAAHQ